MGKIFFKPNDRFGQSITLTGDTAHYIINVLRLRKGQGQILCDGVGFDYSAILESISSKPFSATFNVIGSCPSTTEPPISMTLFQGLPKGDKMDWIIEKTIEAGITKIIPVITHRTVVKVKDANKMKLRYMRIAESAASQSMRGCITDVSAPISFAEAITYTPEVVSLVAFEKEKMRTIKTTLQNKPPAPLNLWVGPEGGFEDYEISALTNIGAIPITLGPRILRTETSGIFALAQILSIWE